MTKSDKEMAGWVPGLGVASVVTVVYGLTMSMSVGWADSAELALTAWALGANHSPGSPLHSLLGHLFAHFFAQPFLGTTVLSVVSMALAAVCAALILSRLGAGLLVSACAACLFAFSFQVWADAVVTEVYGLGMACLAASLGSALVWERTRADTWLYMLTLFYGAALAAYFANVLLGPVYLWFVWRSAGPQLRPAIVYVAGSAAALALIVAANYLLARNAFLMGPVRPDTVANMWFYMSGAQHDPLQARSLAGFADRLFEHVAIFSRSVGYVSIPLAAVGFLQLAGVQRRFNGLLLGIFSVYMIYYTFFGSGDYFLMVAPAYFVFSLWAGMGVVWLVEKAETRFVVMAALGVLPCIVAGLLWFQLEGRRAMGQAQLAEQFATQAFLHIPPDALAIAGFRELATLLYLQQVEGARPDVRFILPARTPRYYLSGRVENFMDEVAARVCTTPVVTMKRPDEMLTFYDADGPLGDTPWFTVQPRTPCGPAGER